ncbi:MAG: hypothetical protein LBN24_13820 [Mediterranea sp.]|jgi:hypothetical protein|nr:hypothetical protein [Mediterranea sp.]
MDYKRIEQLLERYWQGDTSVEEEACLRRFFTEEEVPGHLLRYKEWFAYQQVQQELCLGDDFDERLLREMEVSTVKARRVTLFSRLTPLLKAAAVVAVILTLGNVAQHSFTPEGGTTVLATDTIGKQVTAPSVAVSDEGKANQALADSLNGIATQKASDPVVNE